MITPVPFADLLSKQKKNFNARPDKLHQFQGLEFLNLVHVRGWFVFDGVQSISSFLHKKKDFLCFSHHAVELSFQIQIVESFLGFFSFIDYNN